MENEQVRGQKPKHPREEEVNLAAKKVARTLAECKAICADIDLIFARAKSYLAVSDSGTSS